MNQKRFFIPFYLFFLYSTLWCSQSSDKSHATATYEPQSSQNSIHHYVHQPYAPEFSNSINRTIRKLPLLFLNDPYALPAHPFFAFKKIIVSCLKQEKPFIALQFKIENDSQASKNYLTQFHTKNNPSMSSEQLRQKVEDATDPTLVSRETALVTSWLLESMRYELLNQSTIQLTISHDEKPIPFMYAAPPTYRFQTDPPLFCLNPETKIFTITTTIQKNSY